MKRKVKTRKKKSIDPALRHFTMYLHPDTIREFQGMAAEAQPPVKVRALIRLVLEDHVRQHKALAPTGT